MSNGRKERIKRKRGRNVAKRNGRPQSETALTEINNTPSSTSSLASASALILSIFRWFVGSSSP
jgi:hypothetical protein